MFPAVLVAVGLGFLVVMARTKKAIERTIQYDSPTPGEVRVPSVGTVTIPAAFLPRATTQQLPQILASAQKWAKVRGIPFQEVLATIQVESQGNPKAWANLSTEDSRGLMQINIRTWASKLASYGMTVDDLWIIDKNIQVGTDIYAAYRKTVQNLIVQSGVPQSAPIDVLTRLYYKGPVYVKKKILAGLDASRPYKDAEKAVANWEMAMNYASGVTSRVA